MNDSDQALARQVIGLLDLTSLNDDDDEARIDALCYRALTPLGPVAAVCVYPRFVAQARRTLDALGITSVKVATVSNFPGGTDPLAEVLAQTEQALADGADEIDVVYPYRALLAGDAESGRELVAACKAICPPGIILKVILETGELTPALIRQASFDAIASGADFIKTSTGKVRINATTEAVREMLQVLAQTDHPVGLKPSGGMKVLHDAAAYLWMVERLLGPARTTPRHLRFGASSLLDSILTQVGIYSVKANAGAY